MISLTKQHDYFYNELKTGDYSLQITDKYIILFTLLVAASYKVYQLLKVALNTKIQIPNIVDLFW